MLSPLLRPLSYLSIKHQHKWVVDWLYPFILSALSTFLLFYLKSLGPISLYADGAFIAKILGFAQGLPGFYIAALAAIATFNRIDIDKTMPAPAPEIHDIVRGKKVPIELTRRRFLCLMFAFLTAESLILITLAIFGQAIHLPIKEAFNKNIHIYISGTYILVFMFIFWQMLITTFWGLFYLGHRLHQPDQ